MALINPTPVTTPAIPEKTFPEIWLSHIEIAAPSLTQGRIRIESLPFSAARKELGSGADMIAIGTDELWIAAAEVPEVAQAMGAIFACISPLRDWITASEAAKLAEQSATK